jgi:hypothetical protein
VYALVVGLHAWLRWLILLLGVAATARAGLAWSRGRAWSRVDDRLGLFFAVSMDVQFVVGVVLHLGVSAMGVLAIASEGAGILGAPVLRFWAIAHPLLTVGALALAHVGRIRMRGLPAAARPRVATLSFAAALVLLLAGVPWPGGFDRWPLAVLWG